MHLKTNFNSKDKPGFFLYLDFFIFFQRFFLFSYFCPRESKFMGQNEYIEQRYIRELKADSRKAFNALYRMYCARLYAFAYQYTKSREDAEEIVQDTFTKLWMYRASIRQEESLTRFLFQITKNLLINRFHSVVNSPLFEEFVTECHEAASTEKESASSRLEFEEFREMLLSVIRQLPATQQKIVHCRLFDELTPPETAQKLQLSEQTVRNQFSMALKHLRQFLLAKNLAWLFFYLLSVIKT